MENQIENQVQVQPKNQKSGKGKNVAIIILIILLLGAIGYISYDKFMNKNDNETTIQNYKNNIKTLKNEIETLKSNNSNAITNNPLSGFVGKYAYEGTEEFDSVEKYADHPKKGIVAKLEIKEDGTGTYTGGMLMGDVEDAKGNITINKNKIYLLNDNCKEMVVSGVNRDECVSPNCNPIIVFDYNGDKISIAVQNDESKRVELTKQNN